MQLQIYNCWRFFILLITGKHSASRSTSISRTNAGTSNLLSNKSNPQSHAETSDRLKTKDPNEHNGSKKIHMEKTLSSLKQGPCMAAHVSCEGMSCLLVFLQIL